MEKEPLSKEDLKEKERADFKEQVRKEYEPKIRKEYAQLYRDLFIKAMNELRKVQDQFEKGQIPKEDFERREKDLNDALETAEAAEYKMIHGPRIEFFRLIQLRKERGLTQAQAAKKGGMSLAWYAALEQGYQEKISDKFKQKVCDMLGISYEKLFIPIISYWGKKNPEEIEKLFEEEEKKRRKIEPWDRETNPR